MSYEDILTFMEENKISQKEPDFILKKQLNIIELDEKKDTWKVVMKGTKDLFEIIINFPKDFPKSKPEIKTKKEIYAPFLLKWNSKCTKVQVLIGIYLILNSKIVIEANNIVEEEGKNEIKIFLYLEKKVKKNLFISENFKEDFELYIDGKKNLKKYDELQAGKHMIILKFNSKIKNCCEMFKDCKIIKDLDLSNFNTSNVNNMSKMFSGCKNLDKLNLSSFNTVNVTDMSGMFNDCRILKNLDLSSFNTTNVNNMSKMFKNCEHLKTINLSCFITGEVNDMNGIFDGCRNLQVLDITNFNTKNVANMHKMFSRCENLTKLDLSSYNTINVKNMSKMFAMCKTLKLLDLSSFNVENVTDMNGMFLGCENLKTINFLKFNTIKTIDISNLFSGCYSLTSLPDISKWDVSNVKNMSFLFSGCSFLENIPDISKWNTINIENISGLFYECSSLISIPDISKWNTKNLNNMSHLFNGCSSLKSLPDISKWYTGNIKNMSFLFSKCALLISVPDISKLITEEVEDMSYMFYNCSSLNSIPEISKWNTSNTRNLSHMFYGCSKIKKLPDISKWNTNKCQDISFMFYDCFSLKNVPDIFKWNCKNVVNYENLLFGVHCSNYHDFRKMNLKNYKNKKEKITIKDNIGFTRQIKTDNLKYIPQIEIKFSKVNKIDINIISKLKQEIGEIIGKNNFSIIEIRKGSLTALLSLQCVIQSELRMIELEQGALHDILSEEFSSRINAEIGRISEKIRHHNFICLGSQIPEYSEQHVIDITDKEQREELNRKILNCTDDNINIYEAARSITLDDVKQYFQRIGLNAEELEKNQNRLINKLDEYNKFFDIEIEKALKNSIFEYKMINISIIERNSEVYEKKKSICPNIEVKILFHGSNVDAITGILSGQFRDATVAIFGNGVYFTDELDYAWYYAGEKEEGRKRSHNWNNIPNVGATFSVVASQIYYDSSKLEKVYNNWTQDRPVRDNGIRCAHVNADSSALNLTEGELRNYNKFIGNEFLITNKNQILPLYALTFKRIEYLVIWRDYNFNDNNPNSYNNELFREMQKFHREIKHILSTELNSKVYYIKNSDEAIDLINRKIYNKIIIVTNASNDAQRFISDARHIIGSNTIIGISAYNIGKHYNWVQQLQNVLILNGLDIHQKFFTSAINNDIQALNNLITEINNNYRNFPYFNLTRLTDSALNFPKFKNSGSFGELTFGHREEEEEKSKCILF